jgi:hypothetical protein
VRKRYSQSLIAPIARDKLSSTSKYGSILGQLENMRISILQFYSGAKSFYEKGLVRTYFVRKALGVLETCLVLMLPTKTSNSIGTIHPEKGILDFC